MSVAISTPKTFGTAVKPTSPQILLCRIQINTLPMNLCITYSSPTTQNLSELDFSLSRSLKVKSDGVVGPPYTISSYCLMVTYVLNSLYLQDTSVQNLSDLDFGLPSPFNISHDGIGVSVYDFRLSFSSTYLGSLRDTSLQDMSDLAFDLSKSFKVKCYGGVQFPICDFLSLFNSNTWPNWLLDISRQNMTFLRLSYQGVIQGQISWCSYTTHI